MTRLLVLVLAAFSLPAFASTGPPERLVDARADVVKAALVSIMTSAGFLPDSDTQFMLSFWRELSGFQEFGARLFMGNSYSERPQQHVQFVLVPQGDGTLVRVTGDVSVKMPLGTVNRASITGNKRFRKDAGALLDSLGATLGAPRPEAPVEAAAPVPVEADVFIGLATLENAGKPEPASGVGVVCLVGGAPAERAGIRPGDVIVEISASKVASDAELGAALGKLRPGGGVQVKVQRDGGFEEFAIALVSRRGFVADPAAVKAYDHCISAARAAPLLPGR
jgi:hypothetical protein